MTTIYVGNLPFTATEDEVRSLFERYGKVCLLYTSRQVAVLDGGIQAWRSAGGALQAGEVTAESRIFEPGSGPDFITSAEVVAALADPGRLLVDARSPERYAGAVEPLDAVAGHVPGAVNQPFMVNLDAAGRTEASLAGASRWPARRGGDRHVRLGGHRVPKSARAGIGGPRRGRPVCLSLIHI